MAVLRGPLRFSIVNVKKINVIFGVTNATEKVIFSTKLEKTQLGHIVHNF